MKRLILTLPLLLALPGSGQTSPAERIRFLMYESPRPDLYDMGPTASGVFSCGRYLAEARDNRAIADSLATPDAIPAMESALDALEARERQPFIPLNANWLLLAYARAKGPSAYPRFRRMYQMPEYDYALDAAATLAFGLTSYVSTEQRSPVTSRMFFCDRGYEPRDSLNALIRAWEAKDRSAIEDSLGPQAMASLPEIPSRTPSLGVGYRFVASRRPEDTPIETRFMNHRGDACGGANIQFLRAPVKALSPEVYVVNSPAITAILNLITACARP